MHAHVMRRQVAAVFLGLAEIYTIFAENKRLCISSLIRSLDRRWLLQGEDMDPFDAQCRLEDAYMFFRQALDCRLACMISRVLCESGLQREAVSLQKVLWHIRPKLHQLEHLLPANLSIDVYRGLGCSTSAPNMGMRSTGPIT